MWGFLNWLIQSLISLLRSTGRSFNRNWFITSITEPSTSNAANSSTTKMAYKYKFRQVPSIFAEFDKIKGNEKKEIPRQENLGIIEQEYEMGEQSAALRGQTQWARFAEYVKYLNATSDENVSYKLFYVVRHGVGVHNVVMKALALAEAKEIVKEEKIWNKKYSHLRGAKPEEVYVKIVKDTDVEDKDVEAEDVKDEEVEDKEVEDKGAKGKEVKIEEKLPVLLYGAERSVTSEGVLEWVDALLVKEGIDQAHELADFLKTANSAGTPWPQSIYTSPLARCLETTQIVFKDIIEPQKPQQQPHRRLQHSPRIVPVVKEALRERLTTHTCDQRRALSWIKEKYPTYDIEEGFVEDDELWKSKEKVKEEEREHRRRKKALLEDIFEHDDNHFISLTAHSYALTAILIAMKAERFRIREGTMVPIFVRAERIPIEEYETDEEPETEPDTKTDTTNETKTVTKTEIS